MQKNKFRYNELSSTEHEVLLGNEYILTKKMNDEYARITFELYHNKWRTRILIYSIIAFAAAFTVVAVLRWIIPFFILLLAGFYLFFMSWKGYKYGAYVSYKNMAVMCGEPIKMKVLFHPRYFTVSTTEGDRDFLYSQISRRIELEKMSILIVEKEGAISHGQIIDKSAFTAKQLGTYYEILEKAKVDY